MTSPSTSSSAPRPEPVTKAGALAGIVAAVLMLAGLTGRAFGWISDDVDVIAVANRASDVVLGAGALWATLAPIALAFRARGKVTPLSDPRDAYGRVLSAVVEAGPLLDELRAHVAALHTSPTAAPASPSTSTNLSPPAPVAEPAIYDTLVLEHLNAAAPPAPVVDPPTVELAAITAPSAPSVTAASPPVG